MTEQERVLSRLEELDGGFRCSPYFAQLVSVYAPMRQRDVIVEHGWKRYGPHGSWRNSYRTEAA